ncbi:MAG: hypothetical protein FD180_2412 [Planctomycetota bacterium]|nr:MAG: hypothetical protein FD180_2412 [Planctomycetota bacterium]
MIRFAAECALVLALTAGCDQQRETEPTVTDVDLATRNLIALRLVYADHLEEVACQRPWTVWIEWMESSRVFRLYDGLDTPHGARAFGGQCLVKPGSGSYTRIVAVASIAFAIAYWWYQNPLHRRDLLFLPDLKSGGELEAFSVPEQAWKEVALKNAEDLIPLLRNHHMWHGMPNLCGGTVNYGTARYFLRWRQHGGSVSHTIGVRADGRLGWSAEWLGGGGRVERVEFTRTADALARKLESMHLWRAP